MSKLLHHEIHHHSPDSDWVVFVHGAGGSTRTWKRQVEPFKKKYNLLVLDLRGHGYSVSEKLNDADEYSFLLIAQDIVDVMDDKGIEKAHCVGVSLGSIIIRKIEEYHSERVLSIILAGGIFALDLKLRLLSTAANFLSYIIGHRTLYKIFARIALPKENHKKSREIFIRESKKMEYKEFGLWLNLYHELGPTLKALFKAQITVPTLIIMGNEDYLFLPSAKDYAEKFDNVWIEIVQKCGHVVSIQRSAEFNSLSLQFLDKFQLKELIPASDLELKLEL